MVIGRNIVDRGYQTIVPPINHKVMEVSNVAFFQLIRRWPAFRSVFCVETRRAAHTGAAAAWVLTYFFFSASVGNSLRRCVFLGVGDCRFIRPRFF